MVFLLIFLIVSTAMAESPFDKLKIKFDDYNALKDIFNTLSSYTMNIRNAYPGNYSGDECLIFKGNVPTDKIGKLYLNFNRYVESLLNHVDNAILAGKDFQNISSILFKDAINPLNEIDSMFEKYRDLKTNESSTNIVKETVMKLVRYLDFIFGKYMDNNKLNTALNSIFRHAHSKTYAEEAFRDFLINYHGIRLRRCDNFDLVLDHLFYIYLRLVTAEIKGIIMVAQGCVLNTVTGSHGRGLEKKFETMIKTSLKRIKIYMDQTRTVSRFNVSPKCRCSLPPPEKFNIQPAGQMQNFYYLSDKHVTVYTNLTEYMCITLRSHPSSVGDLMMFEICIGERFNTIDSVRKNSKVIKMVMIDNPNRFKEPREVRKFNIDWSNGTLEVTYQETNRWINLITNVKVDQNDLDKISHYAVSSPHVHDRTFIWLLPHVPTLLPRFSPLITAARMCWCENILDDAQLTNFLKLNSTYVCPRFSYNVREYIKNLNSNGDLSLEDFCYDKSTIVVSANEPRLGYDSSLVSGCTTK